MPLFTVQDIVRATRGALVAGDLGVPITGVSIDSRALGVGEAFFAIRGYRFDGHAFLADAASRGAACLVVHALHDDVPANVPLVLVEDTTRALGRLAAYHRARFSIPVVAVTGSNGKTTTKELIAGVLGMRWHVLKPSGSFNNQWGLPLTLLKLTQEHQALVLEIGSQHPGEIATLAKLARPTVAAVTTVAHAHTEFLGSLDGVRAEKVALVRALTPEGRAVLNADDPRVAGMAPDSRAPVITYGRSAGADVRATGDIVERGQSLAFMLENGGARVPVTLAFAGRRRRVRRRGAARAPGRRQRPRRGSGPGAPRVDVRGHGGPSPQGRGSRRRGPRQGVAGHAHGAGRGRAGGASGPMKGTDALLFSRPARERPHRLQRLSLSDLPVVHGPALGVHHLAGGRPVDHPAIADRPARRRDDPRGHARAASHEEGHAHDGRDRHPRLAHRDDVALGQSREPLRVGGNPGDRRLRADRDMGRHDQAAYAQGSPDPCEVRGPARG